eukprot:gene19009-7402_t
MPLYACPKAQHPDTGETIIGVLMGAWEANGGFLRRAMQSGPGIRRRTPRRSDGRGRAIYAWRTCARGRRDGGGLARAGKKFRMQQTREAAEELRRAIGLPDTAGPRPSTRAAARRKANGLYSMLCPWLTAYTARGRGALHIHIPHHITRAYTVRCVRFYDGDLNWVPCPGDSGGLADDPPPDAAPKRRRGERGEGAAAAAARSGTPPHQQTDAVPCSLTPSTLARLSEGLARHMQAAQAEPREDPARERFPNVAALYEAAQDIARGAGRAPSR